ncbi:glycosyltransferase family 4 protein [Qipengyuania sediminis]|uniref:glycosyltransferase family 4 protein n=1 Tax=Qipengyuania sediminis TaxID=1532023 RepID=UPI001059878A|nr:glycosyltransferase family 4 protein [Qipengyuania sediminis]
MRLIFVGPEPGSPNIAHAGGQLTATTGFAAFAAGQGIAVTWIDTAQSNFPVPPARVRIARAASRLLRLVREVGAPANRGVILFAGAGASFVERAIMAAVARACGKPSVLMIRSGHFHTLYRRSPLFRLTARLLLRLPHRIGVQGDSWISLLTEAGAKAEQIAVVPNWLGAPAHAPDVRTFPADRPLHLLFAGWMTVEKGVPELIAAARSLVREGTAIRLTLAGGGSLLEDARAAAAEPDLAGRLTVTGWLGREDLAAEMGRADLFILPSHAEGFPNVVMEALAEGLPIIATPVGAIPDSVADGVNGRLVPVRNAEAIAGAVRSYVADPHALERHSRAALATAAARHDRDTNCRALLEALSIPSGDLRAIAR